MSIDWDEIASANGLSNKELRREVMVAAAKLSDSTLPERDVRQFITQVPGPEGADYTLELSFKRVYGGGKK